ncbi:MAG: preprotein translocase subunit SecA, partial [Verrucomicrobiota bacterium]
MFNWILKKIIGSKNQREIRRLQPLVRRINELEPGFQHLTDEGFRAKTAEWKDRLSKIEDPVLLAAELEALLPEAFALVKCAAKHLVGRSITVCDQPLTWNMVHFDVQLIGGMILHRGRIAEMATGEGKTLVATLAVYLNAITGRGVHVVTVNDYLAKRDAEWMGQLYTFLGLTVGVIQNDQTPEYRRAQYQCDITYGTNSEFGFDYLRDNGMATSREQQVQRGHFFAIVDEVDSILIDEARTPLIISGPATVSTHQYDRFKPLIEQLVRKQTMLCNRLASEAKEQLEAGRREEAGRTMFKLKLGQPRNKALLRMMEDPEMRKVMDKAELEFYKDTDGKAALVELKEELFFTIEERQHDADLTELGRGYLNPDDPNAFVLPDLLTEFADIENDPALDAAGKAQAKGARQQHCDAQAERIHNIAQLLKAYCLYEKDVEYVVEENKVMIVDTFTGRKMPGRRWSDGLHQAVEAKEGVQIDRETQTLATITIQNYYRLYEKLAGMTGTAETEASEFFDIYKLGVLVIPPNRPLVRKDANDSVYKTKREKFNAVLNEIKAIHAQGRPILVGTISVEISEQLSRMLQREKLIHSVLNAKFHQQEAEIVTRAGQRGGITIATNMAGRGTDIKLGAGVQEVGGLHVIGTERHESRRIDRQLRGRCARQGDPGSSHFFISLEDDLMRLFGSDKIVKYMEKMGLEEGQELEAGLLNRSIQTAQKRVEAHNFQIRKRTLEYDDVMNKQREVIYGFRNEIIRAEDVRDRLMDIMEEVVVQKVEQFTSPDAEHAEWKTRALADWVNLNFPIGVPEAEITKAAQAANETPVAGSFYDGLSAAQFSVCNFISESVRKAYELKVSFEQTDALKEVERYTILSAIDKLWQEHLYEMDSLR